MITRSCLELLVLFLPSFTPNGMISAKAFVIFWTLLQLHQTRSWKRQSVMHGQIILWALSQVTPGWCPF